MKKNKMLWLSIAATALLVTGHAFAADTTAATPTDTNKAPVTAPANAEAAKHHGRHHKGMHHAGMKAKEAAKTADKTEKKTT